MTIFELSVLSAAGMLVFLAVGFLWGMGYQKTEDSREFRKNRNEVKRVENELMTIRAQLQQAQKKVSDLEWEKVLKDPMADLFPATDIKFGDEN